MLRRTRGVIDGNGKFVIPGLIDSHAHAAAAPWASQEVREKHPELIRECLQRLPRAFLAFGFTTVIDLDLQPVTLKTFGDAPLHPTLFHCGPAVRTAGGYGSHVKDANIADRRKKCRVRSIATSLPVPSASRRSWTRDLAARSIGRFRRPETLAAIRPETSKRGPVMIVHANDVSAPRAPRSTPTPT